MMGGMGERHEAERQAGNATVFTWREGRDERVVVHGDIMQRQQLPITHIPVTASPSSSPCVSCESSGGMLRCGEEEWMVEGRQAPGD